MQNKLKIEGKYFYRAAIALLFMIIATAIFFYNWYEFVQINNQTGHLTGKGNLGMAVIIYAILYLIVGKWMHAFKIGVERKANLLASQVLTLFLVAVFEVLVSMAITGQFRFAPQFIRVYFLMFLLQALIICIAIIPSVNLYRVLFPPLHILEICGDNHNNVASKFNGVPYKYHIDKLMNYREGLKVIKNELCQYDAVLINDIPDQDENQILKACFDADKRVYFVPKISDVIVKSSEDLNLFDTPLYLCRNIGMTWWQSLVKRTLDILLSGLALVVLSPLMLIVALAIKLEDHGPVFYRQERCTIGGKRFMILKFRSMIVDAENDGKPHPAGEKDDRITKVGKVIRACRVDELPQLVNILKGEMSIVGPRPERVEHVIKYTESIPEFTFRYKVKGGLTGAAQVFGKYNTTALDKLKMDLAYITNYSLLLDVQIVFQTIKVLVQKESTEGFSEEASKQMHDADYTVYTDNSQDEVK